MNKAIKGYEIKAIPKAVAWSAQKAIPWCTTHGCSLSGRGGVCLKRLAAGRPDQMDACVLSFGGPEHKWWHDE
jgi:hypothetical protein